MTSHSVCLNDESRATKRVGKEKVTRISTTKPNPKLHIVHYTVG